MRVPLYLHLRKEGTCQATVPVPPAYLVGIDENVGEKWVLICWRDGPLERSIQEGYLVGYLKALKTVHVQDYSLLTHSEKGSC